VKRRPSERIWLTPQQVGNLTGFSAGFIRKEITAKELPAQWIQSARTKAGRWRIHLDDATAYAKRIGVWRERA